MLFNDFFRRLARFADKYYGKKMGDEFRAYIVKPELTPEQEDSLEIQNVDFELEQKSINERMDIIEDQQFRFGEPTE